MAGSKQQCLAIGKLGSSNVCLFFFLDWFFVLFSAAAPTCFVCLLLQPG
jgi:hypothetical protein